MGGTNVHLLVSEAPPASSSVTTTSDGDAMTLPWLVSGRSADAADAMAEKLTALAGAAPHAIARALMVGREHFAVRRAMWRLPTQRAGWLDHGERAKAAALYMSAPPDSEAWAEALHGWTHNGATRHDLTGATDDPAAKIYAAWVSLVPGAVAPSRPDRVPAGAVRQSATLWIELQRPGAAASQHLDLELSDPTSAFIADLTVAWLAGLDVAWEKLVGPTTDVHLPVYAFDTQRVRRGRDDVVRPSRRPSGVTNEHAAAPSAQASSDPPALTLAAMMDIWADVLGDRPHDADADFYDLGGDSLAALEVVTVLEARFGVQIEADDVFENPTPRALHERTAR
jgi:acyl transferase domain-containing protein